MQALLFEVMPRPGHEDHYLERAAALRPELEKNAGLMFIDRFRSLERPGLILSHSLWKDEASLARWRVHAKHQVAQKAGRNTHFADYRLRIAQVLEEAQDGEANTYNDPELIAPRFVALIESAGEPFGGSGESFSSVYRDDAYITVTTPETRENGEQLMAAAAGRGHVTSSRLCLVSRDYGMFDRAEAPQYFPPAVSASN